MSVYFKEKRKWWEYYFRYEKQPYTAAGFKKKKDAQAAEAERKKEIKQPKIQQDETDMDFLTLLNRRLDFVQAYRSQRHYTDTLYMAKKWAEQWKGKTIHQINSGMLITHLIATMKKVSAHAANKELRGLRALWNFGIKPPNRWFINNPTDGIEFFPVVKKDKYIPPIEDVIKVLLVAEGEVQDYLWTIALTMARMSEINKLEVEDVDFENRIVTLYTKKSKGGNTKSRKVPMSKKLEEVLKRRVKDNNTKWVFPHTYYSRKAGEWITGRYQDRKRIMKTLCKKAGVKYFRFHPFRHFGASWLERDGYSIKTIQDLLGHANRTTTEIYIHSLGSLDRKAMDSLNNALSGVENVLEFKKRKT